MIYLAGDSVFDNSSYARPSVIEQMGSDARLLARDGAVLSDLVEQVDSIAPSDDDVLVISVGGNDALPLKGYVTGNAPASIVLREIGSYVYRFELEYMDALSVIRLRNWKRIVACTIYNGQFEPSEQGAISAAVRIFDDAISRAVRASNAMHGGVSLLDLRDVFTESNDFANPIEPSATGGWKLVAAIRRAAR